MEEKIRLTYLFDFYGDLLHTRQSDIFQKFVFQDLSLQEMAEEEGVSRQAVHDKVRRAVRALEEYEAKLGLLEKYHRISAICDSIEEAAGRLPETQAPLREEITMKLEEIKEVL